MLRDYFLTGLFLLSNFVLIIFFLETISIGSTMRGGECSYQEYAGHAKIVSVQKTVTPTSYKNPTYESYDIKFSFSFNDTKIDEFCWIEDKPHTLRLANSWYPGLQFLKKYGIEVGKIFECRVKILTEGTCTPVLFEFQDIYLDDYFEIKK